MENATMLYRPGGAELLHGHMVDYTIVDEDEVPDLLADGWFKTPTEAGESVKAKEPEDDKPATRDELEAKAKELEIKFDGRTTDKKLGELIAEKLKA